MLILLFPRWNKIDFSSLIITLHYILSVKACLISRT